MTISRRSHLCLVGAILALVVAPLAAAGVRDGRSPDTLDAAAVASFDGRSPDTVDAAVLARDAASTPLAVVDGRSPDTSDASFAAHTVAPTLTVVDAGGFDWVDAGIGAAGGLAIAFVVGGALLVLTTRNHDRKLAA